MNHITIELCAEDRARLDRLAVALERKTCDSCVNSALAYKEGVLAEAEQKLAETLAKTSAPTETPKNAPEATKTATPPVTQPEEKAPTEAENTATSEENKPAVTLEQIQQKVVQLAAGNGGAKKARAREIINAYGAKVSDLKDMPDKWAEVWGKLTALESEA